LRPKSTGQQQLPAALPRNEMKNEMKSSD